MKIKISLSKIIYHIPG